MSALALSTGEQAKVVITVRANARGSLTTIGSVRAEQPDPVVANNSASQTTVVTRR